MIAMILMILFSIFLTFSAGIAHDTIVDFFIGQGIDGGQGTRWDTTRDINIQTQLFYFILWCPGILGVVQFLIICTRRQRRDDYAQDMTYMEE